MRISKVSVVLHDRRTDVLKVFGVTDGRLPMGVLRIETDEGIEGNSFISGPGPGAEAIARQIVASLKPLLVGRDPLDIGLHWTRMNRVSRSVDQIAIGVVDVALWDIVGKVAGLPIHRLLGTYRDKVPAYFSSGHHDSAEEYAEEAAYWHGQGWRGYKLHPPSASWDARPRGPIAADIEASTAVRAGVGDELTLMLDASWGYTYPEALKVGGEQGTQLTFRMNSDSVHWKPVGLPFDPKVNCTLPLFPSAGGPSEMLTSGPDVATGNVRVSGVGSVDPNSSVPCTSNV